MAFDFLAVRFLLFQNNSDPDVTPNITCLLLLLEDEILITRRT